MILMRCVVLSGLQELSYLMQTPFGPRHPPKGSKGVE